MADPMRAQSAVDRLQNAAYELVVEGDSYRKRQKPLRAELSDLPGDDGIEDLAPDTGRD